MENRPAPLRSRRVCRFCLTENEPLSFIYDRELSRPFQVPLTLQIMSCVAIEVYSADGMPQVICNNCRWNLDRCYRFKQQCKKADEALRAYPVSGVLPRPFPPLSNEPPESSNKRTLDTRSPNEQIKKARLDNGDRERQISHQGQRQMETRAEKQQREKEERREMYDDEQDVGSDGEHENSIKEDTKLEPGEIRVHACNQCERTFPLLQSLQLHIQRAHRDRDFKCTECDRMFFNKYDLSKHMSVHSEEKPYSCQICQKQFSRANLLQRHEKVHREELRYGCQHCDREFFTPEDLEKHEEAVHKTVKPFQCNLCNKRFTYKQGLERHEMLHNDDKSFVCEYCKEAFRTSTKLARHLTTHAGHRPYVCKLCPRTFLLSHHLTRHMRSHSVEKRHQCEDCGKAFKRKESLEVHQLTHVKRPGLGLTCDVCQESCRNRADYVTHIKQHIEAGEKMGPDGLPPENKDKIGDTESEEEEEEEEDQYSDDDYEPPSSYVYSKKNLQKSQQKPKVESEEEQLEKDDKKEQVVYVRNKDGNLVKKTIKTLMPIQRRGEQQQQTQETKPKVITTPQLNAKTKEEVQTSQLTPKSGRVDETEAQVQKIVASVFKEHKIPLKHQAGQEQTKDSPQAIPRQASQPVLTPTIIKEERLDTPIASINPKNTVKVIKRIIVKKPVGSVDASSPNAITGPIQEAIAAVTSAQASTSTASTSGAKVTKRVIVRRIIRQGDTTREVIMNPDGTIIDPAELAKLPTGNVVKRVVVKKPLDKGQNIEAMLQSADAKRIIRMAEAGEDLNKISSTITTPKAITAQRAEHPPQPLKQVPVDDQEKNEKIVQLEKTVEQQQRRIMELQRKQEYEAGDDMMLPERHDESEDEQQLPLKRVFVKRKQSIYDEEREYNDDTCVKEKEQTEVDSTVVNIESSKQIPKEEELSQESTTEKITSPSRSIEDAKIIIIKPEEHQPDVDEMSRELCDILDSTETVAKMQENVLNNLTQITEVPVEETSAHKRYAEVAEEAVSQEEVTVMMQEQPMGQEEIITGDMEPPQEQVVEEMNGQQDPVVKIVITQSEDDGVKLQFEETQGQNNQVVVTEEANIEKTESGLSNLSTQVLCESNDIFETSDAAMEVEVDKSQEQSNLDESVIELSATNETINLNETTDSRDSLEDKLSQMEG